MLVKKAVDPSLGGDLNEARDDRRVVQEKEGLVWTVEAGWLAGTSRHRHGKTRGDDKSK